MIIFNAMALEEDTERTAGNGRFFQFVLHGSDHPRTHPVNRYGAPPLVPKAAVGSALTVPQRQESVAADKSAHGRPRLTLSLPACDGGSGRVLCLNDCLADGRTQSAAASRTEDECYQLLLLRIQTVQFT